MRHTAEDKKGTDGHAQLVLPSTGYFFLSLAFVKLASNSNSMSDLKQVLMNRDGMSSEEADSAISEMRERVLEGEDPEEILLDEYSLEPDYVFDIITF